MASGQADTVSALQPEQVFSEQDLDALLERIKSSGELGRSKVYASLLEYLLQCSINGSSPKEVEIAVEVLGKDAEFDVARDSSVRVYVHQLRKKLDSYYQNHEPDAAYRIAIPKGQYAIAAIASNTQEPSSFFGKQFRKPGYAYALLAIIAILLLANLVILPQDEQGSQYTRFYQSPVWESIIDDDIPIMLVMGDYYIFGELNEQGNIGRMVRDFSINSPDDLEEKHFSDWETTHNYQDLNLSYIPEGSAYALTRIIPALSASGKRLHVVMMSDLTTVDVRENHIVYVGYISALEKLSELVFAASNLQVGRSFDELLNLDTGRYFTSDAGLPEDGQQFRDYGFFSTFPASSENQIIVIAGMRDAGLMYTSQAVSDEATLSELEDLLNVHSDEPHSLEVLYEVFGVDRMHFDGNLVHSDRPDPNQKWRQKISVY